MAVRDFIRMPVTDLESAENYIRQLVEHDCVYQLGDDPHDVKLFSFAEAVLVSHRIGACYRQEWPEHYECPIGYMMQAIERWNLTKLTQTQKLDRLNTIKWIDDPGHRRIIIAILEWHDKDGDFAECSDAELQDILADVQKDSQ
jgi:hypothetical protein